MNRYVFESLQNKNLVYNYVYGYIKKRKIIIQFKE